MPFFRVLSLESKEYQDFLQMASIKKMSYDPALFDQVYEEYLKLEAKKPFVLAADFGQEKKNGEEYYRVVWAIPGDVQLDAHFDAVDSTVYIVLKGKVFFLFFFSFLFLFPFPFSFLFLFFLSFSFQSSNLTPFF